MTYVILVFLVLNWLALKGLAEKVRTVVQISESVNKLADTFEHMSDRSDAWRDQMTTCLNDLLALETRNRKHQ